MSDTKNTVESVKQKLLNISREMGQAHDLTLARYGAERLLYRLSISPYKNKYVLKGAQSFIVWYGQIYRPTRDIDFLGYGNTKPEHLVKVFRDICSFEGPENDGLLFDVDNITAEEIRAEEEYDGIRVVLTAFLDKTRIPLQADIGFGDAITPAPVKAKFPTLLDLPAPELMTYPVETFIAEKLEAIVSLGIANSRMKDFYDLYELAAVETVDGSTLVKAIQATFKRRGTAPPSSIPLALTDEFAEDSDKQKQWRAFVRKSKLPTDKVLDTIIKSLSLFLAPPLVAAFRDQAFKSTWQQKRGWIAER